MSSRYESSKMSCRLSSATYSDWSHSRWFLEYSDLDSRSLLLCGYCFTRLLASVDSGTFWKRCFKAFGRNPNKTRTTLLAWFESSMLSLIFCSISKSGKRNTLSLYPFKSKCNLYYDPVLLFLVTLARHRGFLKSNTCYQKLYAFSSA